MTTLELARWIALALVVVGGTWTIYEIIRICDEQRRGKHD